MRRLQIILGMVAVVCLTAAGMLLMGTQVMHAPDADPSRLALGGMLSQLRDGALLSFSDAYPQAWDEVHIALCPQALSRADRSALFAYNPAMSISDESLSTLLFWQKGHLVLALQFTPGVEGYPLFQNDSESEAPSCFTFTRESAVFRCVFVPAETSRDGYYVCTPALLRIGVGETV